MTLSAIVCDLASPLASRLQGKVDLLIFNPPYVPTEEEEVSVAAEKRGIESSWAGGLSGMAVTSRLLCQVKVTSQFFLFRMIVPNGVP
jgi:release factor glutamine methyltransferase